MYKYFTQPNGRDSEFEFTCDADEHSFALYRQVFRPYLTALSNTAYEFEDGVLTTAPRLRHLYKIFILYVSAHRDALKIDFYFDERRIDSLNFAQLQLEFMHLVTQIETKYKIVLKDEYAVEDIRYEGRRLRELIQSILDNINNMTTQEKSLNV